MYDQLRPSFVRKPDAHSRIFHGTGNARPARIALIGVLHRQKRLLQSCGAVCDLPVGKDFPRLNGIAVADLPGRDAHLLRQKVNVRLQSKLTLTDAESPERSSRRIICIISVSSDIRVLITVGSHRMGARPLQNRAAQRCICPRIEINLTVQSRKDPVFITSQRERAFHGVALRMEIDGLLPGKHDLYRPLHFHCGQRRDMLGGHVFFSAEPSADQLVLNHDALRIPPEHDSDLFSGVVDSLVGGIDLHAVLIGERHRALRLKKSMLRKRRRILLRHHIF